MVKGEKVREREKEREGDIRSSFVYLKPSGRAGGTLLYSTYSTLPCWSGAVPVRPPKNFRGEAWAQLLAAPNGIKAVNY